MSSWWDTPITRRTERRLLFALGVFYGAWFGAALVLWIEHGGGG